MLCPFCERSEPAQIDLSTLDLQICPTCFSTFLPASQFSELRRSLNNTTREMWIKKLLARCNSHANENLIKNAEIRCLLHNKPLVKGVIPNFSFEGLVPECCDLQHLPPDLMIKILEVGLGAGVGNSSGLGMGGLGVSRPKANPIAEFLGGIVFRFWEKRQKTVDDGIDRLQWNFKFKDILGEWSE